MRLSVVIPFFNEEAGVAALFARLRPVLDALPHPSEIICVDDGSRDSTVARLRAAQADEPRIVIVRLSRNFGKEAALTAGLDHAGGDAVMIMDADLQHPPELIPRFIETLQSGFDMVYGVRRDRATDGRLRAGFSRAFYKLMGRWSEVAVPENAGDFRILSRRAVDAIGRLGERGRFMKGLYAWIGFPQTALEFDVAARTQGASAWSGLRLLSYAWDGLVSFTNLPLRAWSAVGLLIALLSGGYALFMVIDTAILGNDVPGFPTVVTAIFFLGGMQLLSVGILGEYIARIFTETKQRPVYLVDAVLRGREDKEPS